MSTLSPFEVEHIISELSRSFGNLDLAKYGTIAWIRDHAKFEKLNRTAHLQAVESTDEYVIDLALSHSSNPPFLSKVIAELVSIQFWREKVFPPLEESGAIEASASARSYLVFHHESVLLNFLEVAFFHKSAVSSLSDHVVDLVDLVYTKLVKTCQLQPKLQTLWRQSKIVTSHSATCLAEQVDLISYSQGLTCLNILRFLVDSRSDAPVTFTSRILRDFDIPMLLVPLLDNPPWVRVVPAPTRAKAATETAGAESLVEVFADGQWSADSGFVSKSTAQVLLILYSLVLDPDCIARYELSSSSMRKDNLLRVRKFLTADVIDQIPLLGDLLRALEELAISGGINAGGLPGKGASVAGIFAVEIVPEFRDALEQKFGAAGRATDAIKELVAKLKKEVYRKDSKEEAMEIVEALSVYDENFFEPAKMTCPVCNEAAEQRCSGCKKVFYCSRDCQVKHWSKHKLGCVAK